MILKIAYYGDPVLRLKAAPIEQITDEIRKLAQDMIETMIEYHGVGIAAPQVGVSLRLFVARSEEQLANGEWLLGEPQVYINPKILEPSEEMIECTEGCISLPKLRGAVSRPQSITFEATNLEGEKISLKLSDHMARIMMHENDHLNGVLYIDRMKKGPKRDALDPFLREIKKKYSSS